MATTLYFPEFVFSYQGVNVFRMHKNGFGSGRATIYNFSTSGFNGSWHEAHSFSSYETLGVHSVPYATSAEMTKADGTPDPSWLERYEARQVDAIKTAIDKGIIQGAADPLNQAIARVRKDGSFARVCKGFYVTLNNDQPVIIRQLDGRWYHSLGTLPFSSLKNAKASAIKTIQRHQAIAA